MSEAAVQSINQHTQKTSLDWLYNILIQPATGTGSGVAPDTHIQYKLSLDLLRQALVEVTNVVNNITTEVPGKVLDARQGKALSDAIAAEIAKYAQPNGIATLGSDGKIPSTQIPSIALVDVFPVDSEAAMLASGAEQGDMAIRTDTSQVFILSASPATTLENWIELSALKALVDAAIADIAGAGRTTETVKGNADAIETLNADDTTEGSVAKTVKDAVEPIIEDVADHETRLDTTELTLARHDQDLASVKQTLQQGNGATLDFSDIGIVPLDARATGRANPTIEGLTVTQLVENGDFTSSDLSKFSAGLATVSLVNNIIELTPTSSLPNFRYTGNKCITGEKYFVFARVKGNANTNYIYIRYRDVSASIDATAKNVTTGLTDWQIISGISTVLTDGNAGGVQVIFNQDSVSTPDCYIDFMGLINLTSTYGAGNEPSEADCAKIFSYFDGTKSIQLPARIISKSEDESESSTLYIADNEEVRSVPAISDEVLVENGTVKKVQNVQRYVLQESDIIVVDGVTTTQRVRLDRSNFTGVVNGESYSNHGISGQIIIEGFQENKWNLDNPPTTAIGTWSYYRYPINDDPYLVFTLGTYASLAEAQADLAGTVIYYQLATPTITPLLTSGILQAKPNGTVYYEPYYEGSHQTDASSQITLPYEGTIEKLTGYDENLEPYEVPSTGYTLVGTTLTITGAVENEVFYVELSRSEPLAPEMSVNVINNEQVTLDTVNGKYYKITHTTANGVPTTVATEVL